MLEGKEVVGKVAKSPDWACAGSLGRTWRIESVGVA